MPKDRGCIAALRLVVMAGQPSILVLVLCKSLQSLRGHLGQLRSARTRAMSLRYPLERPQLGVSDFLELLAVLTAGTSHP